MKPQPLKKWQRFGLAIICATAIAGCKTSNQAAETKEGFGSVGGAQHTTRTDVSYERITSIEGHPFNDAIITPSIGAADNPSAFASFVPRGRVLCFQMLTQVDQVINIMPSGEFPAPNPTRKTIVLIGSREGSDRSVCASITSPIPEDLILSIVSQSGGRWSAPGTPSMAFSGYVSALMTNHNGNSVQVGAIRSYHRWKEGIGTRITMELFQLCNSNCTAMIDNNVTPPKFSLAVSAQSSGYGQAPARTPTPQPSVPAAIDRRTLQAKMDELAARNGDRVINFGTNGEGEDLVQYALNNRLQESAATYFTDWLRTAEGQGVLNGQDTSDIRVRILLNAAPREAGSIRRSYLNDILKTAVSPTTGKIQTNGTAWPILLELVNDSRLDSGARTELQELIRKAPR